jgi:hypothetical protein
MGMFSFLRSEDKKQKEAKKAEEEAKAKAMEEELKKVNAEQAINQVLPPLPSEPQNEPLNIDNLPAMDDKIFELKKDHARFSNYKVMVVTVGIKNDFDTIEQAMDFNKDLIMMFNKQYGAGSMVYKDIDILKEEL